MNYLDYLIEGHCRIVTERVTYCVEPGDVFYIPKGLKYQSVWEGERIEFLTFGFNELAVQETLKTQFLTFPLDAELAAQVQAIPIRRGGVVTCRSLSMFYDLLDRFMPQLRYTVGKDERIVKRAKRYMSEHNNFNMPEVAAACGISEPHLYSVFKKAVGMTPNEIKQQIQCEKAVDLLITTDMSVGKIAETLGFSSDSYFRKIFKQYTGTAPLKVRKEQGF